VRVGGGGRGARVGGWVAGRESAHTRLVMYMAGKYCMHSKGSKAVAVSSIKKSGRKCYCFTVSTHTGTRW